MLDNMDTLSGLLDGFEESINSDEAPLDEAPLNVQFTHYEALALDTYLIPDSFFYQLPSRHSFFVNKSPINPEILAKIGTIISAPMCRGGTVRGKPWVLKALAYVVPNYYSLPVGVCQEVEYDPKKDARTSIREKISAALSQNLPSEQELF